MRLALDTGRLIGRARQVDRWTLLEAALLALIAVQLARLVWTVLTPVGPVGDWRPGSAAPVSATGVLGSFDPFFRLAGGSGPAVVTSLNLKLYGIRQDQASGRGSAIIATSAGQQKSVAVGEEIEPGVILKSVEFDSVTIERGGQIEQLFMDQSQAAGAPGAPGAPAASTNPVAPPSVAPPPVVVQPKTSVEPGGPPVPPSRLQNQVSFETRGSGGRVTGVVVRPAGSGDAFRALGLAPGDVVTAVNGKRIRSAEEAKALAATIGGGGRLALQVEREGRVMTLRAGQ
jgi:general secretion pathway protein C